MKTNLLNKLSSSYRSSNRVLRITVAILVVALGLVGTYGIFSNTRAQVAPAMGTLSLGYSLCDYNGNCEVPQGIVAIPTYSPTKGPLSPLNTDAASKITVSLKNIGITTDSGILDGVYNCTVGIRKTDSSGSFAPLTDANSTATTVPYTLANGCSFVIKKSNRLNNLSVDLKYTVTRVTDNFIVGEVLDTYTMISAF
jgi:hypothetical protein